MGLDTHLTHLCSQITPSGQVFEPEQTVPVSCTSPTWVMMDHLTMEKHRKNKARVLPQAGKKLHYLTISLSDALTVDVLKMMLKVNM